MNVLPLCRRFSHRLRDPPIKCPFAPSMIADIAETNR
jgi:hypothetical protein